ncbi:hypothetical protein [Nocardia sp. NPDC051832]|uniref:hypothetical protein n=1 Tax=Nocardia sp. NPDC051832 TaxID=3155673 RepID=UPI00342F39B8
MSPQVEPPYKAGDSGPADTLTEQIKALNATQIGNSWSLPVPEGASSKVPVVAVRDWLSLVGPALDTDDGRAAVAKEQTGAAAVLSCAPAIASFADSHTGRRITASYATMAEQCEKPSPRTVGDTYSEGTVRKVIYVLAAVGLMKRIDTGRHLNRLEMRAARAHHGGHQTHVANVWHLTTPRPNAAPAAAAPKLLAPRRKSASLSRINRSAHRAAAANSTEEKKPEKKLETARAGNAVTSSGHLSSPTLVGEDPYVANGCFVPQSSQVEKKSPTRARSAHAGKNLRRKAKKTRSHQDPFPLHVQQAGAELVSACHGLDRGQWINLGAQQYIRRRGWHIGSINAALVEFGVDTERFDGYAIAAELTRYFTENRLAWPNRIANPIAFVRWALAQIDWATVVSPTEPAVTRHARQQQEAAQRVQRCPDHPHAGRRRDGECSACFSEKFTPETAVEPHQSELRTSPGNRDVRSPTGGAGAQKRSVSVILGRTSLEQDLAAADDGVCMVCSAPGTLRYELPKPMPVCDRCCDSFGIGALTGEYASADVAV